MSTFAKQTFVRDSWQTPRNARTLAAYMALQNSEIGERIAELRRARGNPPQEVIAEKLDVSYRSYQAWEAGHTKPSWRNLTKLAKLYGVTEEYILLGDNEQPTPMIAAREPTQLDEIQALLIDLSERVARLESFATRGSVAQAIHEAFEDYANRLGREVGKRPARSSRTADQSPAHPANAA